MGRHIWAGFKGKFAPVIVTRPPDKVGVVSRLVICGVWVVHAVQFSDPAGEKLNFSHGSQVTDPPLNYHWQENKN